MNINGFFSKDELVYVSHKYRGDPEGNIIKVIDLMTILTRNYPESIFIAPHLFLHMIIDEENNGGGAMQYCLKLLNRCDSMIVFGEITEGVQEEIDFCTTLPKRFSIFENYYGFSKGF